MGNRTNKRMQWVIRFGCILGLMTALCGCSSTEVVKVAKYAAKEALKTTAPQQDRSEGESSSAKDADGKDSDSATQSLDNLKDYAAYNGEPYVELNDNVPNFTTREKNNTKAFENYHRLDALGRCGTAYANICKELMPTEKRGAIGMVKPSGWNTVKYDVVDGKYLYNRCHLIGFQLAGENANKKNLITGTRYLNVDGMLPFEDEVADYVKDTDHHVLYRVTPVFKGDNLVAEGVEMEAYSVEDKGKGICFHVFVYNVQPGVTIDYATGESRLSK
ncbi:DNA/RNA non-specific endonuclease [Clostridium sp. OM05-9BH]|jgi:DNA-entry nuclease|uniref:DNA/RNA non-specific endonuclease n=1 Tax=unclassified Clostridium TaxID=2614128 RepID=UPI00267DABC7